MMSERETFIEATPSKPIAIIPSNPPSPEFSRSVTTPDTDGAIIPSYSVWPFQIVRLNALCDHTPSSLTLEVLFLNSTLLPVGTARIQFISIASRYGAYYLATSGDDCIWPIAGARAIALKVDSIMGGTWTITAALA